MSAYESILENVKVDENTFIELNNGQKKQLLF